MTVVQRACDRTSTKILHDGEFHLPKCDVPRVARPSCICTAQKSTLGSDQCAWSFVAWLWHAFIRRNPIFHSISPKPGCREKKNKWKIELQTSEEEEPTMGREFDEWQTEGRKLNAEREKFEEGENFFKVPIRRRFVTWLSRSWGWVNTLCISNHLECWANLNLYLKHARCYVINNARVNASFALRCKAKS